MRPYARRPLLRSASRIAPALWVVLTLLSLLACPASADVSYLYDELGRLIAVVDPASDTAIYTYDAVGNLLAITRQSSSQVTIIDFSPKSGPIGTSVTISGTGFSATPSQNTVTFNGTPATVSSATTTQIVTTVPTGATTGPISVTAPAGSATSTTPFTVTSGPPTITGFTPTIGTPGTVVTITGTNFDPIPANDLVLFNTNIAQATVTSAAATTIVTAVPSNVGSGRIAVTTPTGTAVSTQDFFIPPSPGTAADVQVTGRMAIGESRVVTITTAQKNGLIVFDATAGQRVILNITNVTIPGWFVAVYDPRGILVGSTSQGGSLAGVINLALLSAGTHTILVDPLGSATGSLTLVLANASDLTPTALTAPASAATQQAISVSWTVLNQGAGPAQPVGWQDFLYLSTDTLCCTGDTFVTSVTPSTTVAAGASYTQTPTVTVPSVSAGNYNLIVRVDFFNFLYEADEANNQRVVPITITTPDLTPTALSGPTAATAQQSISVSWTVTNQGTGATQASWSDQLYLSTDTVCCTGDTSLGSWIRPSALNPGASYSQTKTVTIPSVPAGTYYLILRADNSSQLYEANETNNDRVLGPITVTTPDITPTALTGPTSVTTQQSISVSWTVTNQGTGATQASWSDQLYLSTDTVCCTGDTSMGSWTRPSALNPGASYSQAQNPLVPNVPAGTYYFILRADSLSQLYEADETNNNRVLGPITITNPDLTPTALTAPSSAAPLQSISVTFTVTNQGTGATASQVAWTDRLYLSTDTVCCTGDTSLGSWTRPSALNPGASYTQTKTVTIPNVSAGSYYLILRADDSLFLYESDETNNTRVVPITISP